MWYIYTMEYYSAKEKEWNNAICSNMDATRYYHTKWSKSERERQMPWYCLFVESKNNDTNELIHKTEINPQTQKTNFWLPKGKWGGGIN